MANPAFWNTAIEAYETSTAHTFLLHGDGIEDYTGTGSVDLINWLQGGLCQAGFDLVLIYDPAQGITFPKAYDEKTGQYIELSSMRRLFFREVINAGTEAQQPAAPANPLLAAQMQQSAAAQVADEMDLSLPLPQALPLLDAAMKLATRPNPDNPEVGEDDEPTGKYHYYRIAVVFSMANLTFPANTIGPMPPSMAQAMAYIKTWMRNALWRAVNAPQIWFITPGLTEVADTLRNAYAIKVTAPDYDARLTYAESVLASENVKLAEGMSQHRLASMTAGLLRIHIEDVIVQARINQVPLTVEMVRRRKDEIMEARFSGVLETSEATGSLDDIAGLDYLKDYLRDEIVTPMQSGDTQGMPMGVLMAGPPGTGKTYIAEKLAASAGVNFVLLRMSNILGGIVGESEANLEKALTGIQEMTPAIVFIDEVEQSIKRDSGNSGSSVMGNIFGRLLNAMSDSRNRGKVVWLMATNRPDLLDAAFKRSGRIDAKFAVMPPDNDQERAEMFELMARKNGVSFGKDVTLMKIAPCCEDYTGADIEVIVLKALKVARAAGRKQVKQSDLAHAVKAIRVATSQQARNMIALALDEVNDLDNLPPSYRKRYMAGEFEAVEEPEPAEVSAPAGRRGRSGLNFNLDD